MLVGIRLLVDPWLFRFYNNLLVLVREETSPQTISVREKNSLCKGKTSQRVTTKVMVGDKLNEDSLVENGIKE